MGGVGVGMRVVMGMMIMTMADGTAVTAVMDTAATAMVMRNRFMFHRRFMLYLRNRQASI
jgi:hypothetical protein